VSIDPPVTVSSPKRQLTANFLKIRVTAAGPRR